MFQKSVKRRPHIPVTFDESKDLVNQHISYMTLGEMVAKYHRTGEMPPVGQREGVMLANDLDDPNVVPAKEIFDRLDDMRHLQEQQFEAEAVLAKENADKAAADAEAKVQQRINDAVNAAQIKASAPVTE